MIYFILDLVWSTRNMWHAPDAIKIRKFFPPILVPDDTKAGCSHCNTKFSVLRRRVRIVHLWSITITITYTFMYSITVVYVWTILWGMQFSNQFSRWCINWSKATRLYTMLSQCPSWNYLTEPVASTKNVLNNYNTWVLH